MSDRRRLMTTSAGGGSAVQTMTGSVVGNDSQYMSFNCPFEPDVIYLRRTAPSTALSDRYSAGIIIWKSVCYTAFQTNANTALPSTFAGSLNPLANQSAPYFGSSYENGVLSISSVMNNRQFSSQVTYEYCFVKFT